ncbi:hypothetical protein [Actinoplanes sp. HUAS TT8]
MSARKLIRYASLGLVLAALVGGVLVSGAGHAATSDTSAVMYSTLDYFWS